MTDIYLGIIIMTAFAVALGMIGHRLGRRWPRRRNLAVIMLVVAFMLVFSLLLIDSIWMIRLLPFSNAIVVTNCQLPAVGLLIGLAWHVLPRPAWRRGLLLVPLAGIGLWRAFGPIAGEPPPSLGDRWSDGVCLQSSPGTCGPAAAATLLRAVDIEATEAEMADLCLTRDGGTTFHGLFRGLIMKTAGTPWRVELVSGSTAFLRDSDTAILLNVGLPRNSSGIDPRYERDWGWTPGYLHSVVLFEYLPDDHVVMGDPALGRERWHSSSIDTLWRGKGLRLVPR